MEKQTKTRSYWEKDNFFKPKDPKPKSNISQSVKGICTNLWYMLGGQSILNKKKTHYFDSLVLLGQQYHSYELALEKFKELFWFTYRKQLKIHGEIKSDLGWGCLIRVGQMLLANALKKYFESSSVPYSQENLIVGTFLLISAFLDDSQTIRSNYSYQRIFKMGEDKYNLKTGSWFNISQICYIMMSLQNKNPLKGSEELKMIYFNQTLIFLDEVFQKIKMPLCLCDDKKVICPLCNYQVDYKKKTRETIAKSNCSGSFELEFEYLVIDEDIREDEEEYQEKMKKINDKPQNVEQTKNQETKGPQFDLLLVVSTRLSQQTVDQNNFEGILELMKLKTSMGMVGGVPGKAMYFVGACDDNLIYLDPHLVQNPVNTFNLSKQLNSFHCEDMRMISRQKLDPSVAFAFYIRNLNQLSELIDTIQKVLIWLKQIKKKHPEAVPISYMWENEFMDENQVVKSSELDIDECSPDFSFVL